MRTMILVYEKGGGCDRQQAGALLLRASTAEAANLHLALGGGVVGGRR